MVRYGFCNYLANLIIFGQVNFSRGVHETRMPTITIARLPQDVGIGQRTFVSRNFDIFYHFVSKSALIEYYLRPLSPDVL
jgi:hypothetical protein